MDHQNKEKLDISPVNLLYVDDSLTMLDIIKTTLERDKYITVQTCDSPEIAHPLIIKNRYDLILSDYDMPDINGVDFFISLRKQEIKTPFAIFSSYNLSEVMRFNNAISPLFMTDNCIDRKKYDKEIIQSSIDNNLFFIQKSGSFKRQIDNIYKMITKVTDIIPKNDFLGKELISEI
ncbi:response regulator [Methanospirillum stamsii]|nr:response regulator [Methanospirillum stamsii]